MQNIRVILVEPRGSGNIGAVARAMKNMGLKELALVGRGRTRSFWARAMAVHAKDLLENALRFSSLREAVADCGLVVGTTCRSGLYRSHSRSLGELAPKIVVAAQTTKVGLVFGPEDHGLSNQDLRSCQWLVTIPAHPQYPSLNVAQAAVVCLYELFVASLGETEAEGIIRAPAESVERLFDRMKKVLLEIGFLNPQNPEHILLALRRVLGRAGLEDRDVRILSGLFRQMEWFAQEGWKLKGKGKKGARKKKMATKNSG